MFKNSSTVHTSQFMLGQPKPAVEIVQGQLVVNIKFKLHYN